MAWFGKPGHAESVKSVLGMTLKLYSLEAGNTLTDPAGFRFSRVDSHFRYLVFSFTTVHIACASLMKNPDAVLNECLHTVIRFAFKDPQLFFGGSTEPQHAADLASRLVDDFLQRWSAWLDIAKGGNRDAARSIVASMLREVESAEPAVEQDVIRLSRLGSSIVGLFDDMRRNFG